MGLRHSRPFFANTMGKMTINHTVRMKIGYARRMPGDVAFGHLKGEGTQ